MRTELLENVVEHQLFLGGALGPQPVGIRQEQFDLFCQQKLVRFVETQFGKLECSHFEVRALRAEAAEKTKREQEDRDSRTSGKNVRLSDGARQKSEQAETYGGGQNGCRPKIHRFFDPFALSAPHDGADSSQSLPVG